VARAAVPPRRLVVAITGATGTPFGIRILQMLQGTGVESHLVISRWGARTLIHETPYRLDDVRRMATRSYAEGDQGAAISSGSFVTLGMVIAPCSVKTLGEIAHGYGSGLVHRAADVVLKERRRLVLAVRESPLSEIHLENMLRLARMGAVIAPPLPAFYNRPLSLDDLVTHTASRLLDLFDIHVDEARRWDGVMGAGTRRPKTRARAARPAARRAKKTARA
jgi:4-hydroxy-3-polyprenylbenzoate decarboxylase